MDPSKTGFQYYRVNGTAAGTTTIKADTTVLHAINVGATKTGTVTFYDSASGTNSNYLIAIDNNGTPPCQGNIVDAQLKSGLTVVVSGTTDLLVTYK